MTVSIQSRLTLMLLFLIQTSISWAGSVHLDQRPPMSRCEDVVRAYCEAFTTVRESRGRYFFQLKTGRELECDDGRDFDLSKPKQFLIRLNDTDLKSIKACVYPSGRRLRYPLTPFGWDSGRFRNEALLDAVYGANQREVEANLVKVDFLGKQISFNKKHGAADALFKVGKEIERRYPQIARDFWRVREFAGTYSWRKVSGSELRSVHSWAAAIDLTNWKKPQYWKWIAKCRPHLDCENPKVGKNEATLTVDTSSEIDEFSFPGEPHPQAIVEVFERHGFIWGGKWHHFDSMHFEYRPEFRATRRHCPLLDGVSL